MELENLHQFVQNCRTEVDDTNSLQNLLDTLGEKAKVQCIAPEQTRRLEVYTDDFIGDGYESMDVEFAVQLLTLSFKADCTRCTNPTCDFRRAANPTLANVVRPPVVGVPLNSEGFYDPIVQD